jgi:hypothetical protein
MAGHDRGLQLARTRAAQPRRAYDQASRLSDRGPIPTPTILVGDQDQATGVVKPCACAGTVQPDQREQSQRLRLGGHKPSEQRREPLGILGQVPPLRTVACAREVALIEQQVDNGQDGVQPLG